MGPKEKYAEVLEVTDERDALADAALDLIAQAFPRHERQPVSELRSEIAEKRMGLLAAYDFHLMTVAGERGDVMATAAGVYLEGINAGFITYLAVHPEHRRKRLGREVRAHLVEAFRADARRAEWEELSWVMGEVRVDSPWLRRLVRDRSIIAFDLTYYHPGMVPGEPGPQYVLYRQPIGDPRVEVPAQLVRRLLYSIYRRAYRVRYPLERDNFRAMLAELEGRETVGPHPLVERLAAGEEEG